MEHALPNPSGPSGRSSHPWRTIAVVAAGIATLELLGLLIVGIALLAKPALHRAQSEARAASRPAAKKPAAPKVAPLLPRRLVSVTVLNGNGVSGAAAGEASRVRACGYRIGQVGNAPRGGYGQSVVMYRAGRRGEALRLARDLRIRLVSPLDGLRARDLHGAKLAVVVGG
ncbi:MAG TPA: LytR C-terminal domain-containing protein [Solirubrobacteraceae bacterium]|nr:LytR C-terminal domain-containing protein [Solirubrobacteraceae bacterium]